MIEDDNLYMDILYFSFNDGVMFLFIINIIFCIIIIIFYNQTFLPIIIKSISIILFVMIILFITMLLSIRIEKYKPDKLMFQLIIGLILVILSLIGYIWNIVNPSWKKTFIIIGILFISYILLFTTRYTGCGLNILISFYILFFIWSTYYIMSTIKPIKYPRKMNSLFLIIFILIVIFLYIMINNYYLFKNHHNYINKINKQNDNQYFLSFLQKLCKDNNIYINYTILNELRDIFIIKEIEKNKKYSIIKILDYYKVLYDKNKIINNINNFKSSNQNFFFISELKNSINEYNNLINNNIV